ncbi:unnamed protein product, partial [Rotaria socialis]
DRRSRGGRSQHDHWGVALGSALPCGSTPPPQSLQAFQAHKGEQRPLLSNRRASSARPHSLNAPPWSTPR